MFANPDRRILPGQFVRVELTVGQVNAILVPHRATSRSADGTLTAFVARDGKAVSVVRDSGGFVTQRVLATIVNIAADICQQRIGTPADLDAAVTLGLGYPRGPLAYQPFAAWGKPRIIYELHELDEAKLVATAFELPAHILTPARISTVHVEFKAPVPPPTKEEWFTLSNRISCVQQLYVSGRTAAENLFDALRPIRRPFGDATSGEDVALPRLFTALAHLVLEGTYWGVHRGRVGEVPVSETVTKAVEVC